MPTLRRVRVEGSGTGAAVGVARKPWKPVLSLKTTDDLPRVVDAVSERIECARHVDLGEAAAGVEEAVGTRAVAKNPDDLPRVVDARSVRIECARHVDLGEAAAGIEEAVVVPVLSIKTPTICPASLMPKACVAVRPARRFG